MDGSNSIHCLGCGDALATNQAKLFAEVMVCADCHTVAERTLQRGQVILRRLGLLLKDTVRYALKSGKLRFPSGSVEVVSDQELLQRIVGLYLSKPWSPSASTQTSSPPPSTESTRQDVRSASST